MILGGWMMLKAREIIPEKAEIGVGLALIDGKDYIFFLAGSRYNCPPGEIFFAGIGGHLEQGESLLQCAQREAAEEVELEIEIKDSHPTIFISREGEIKTIQVEERIRPWILYTMVHPPGTPRAGQEYFIFIFRAGMKNIPGNLQPEEIGGLIALSPQEVIKSLEGKKKWGDFKRQGARLMAGGEKLTAETLLYPLGTARALAIVLNRIKG